jgi:hypothetical protein
MKKKIILPSSKYQGAPAQDLNLKIKLENNDSLLREGDMDISLDVLQLFDAERNQSVDYKIYSKLKMVFRNMYSGITGYDPLLYNLYLNGDGTEQSTEGYLAYNEFALLRNDVIREINIPQSGNTLGSFTQNIVLSGFTGHTEVTGIPMITSITAPYQNWNFYLSYAYDQDSNYPMGYTTSGGTYHSFVSGDGIPFEVTNDGRYYNFTSKVPHNMTVGEYFRITGFSINNVSVDPNNLTGTTFTIDSVGNSTYNSELHVINILMSQFPSGTTINKVVTGKRCKDIKNITGTTSTYYIHKMKTLTDVNDYILDYLGFESPIWMEEKKLLIQGGGNYDNLNFLVQKNRMESVILDFKKPFSLSGITNNLGYLPTEVCITAIFRNQNGYFDYPVKVGYKFNFHNNWIDTYFSGSTSMESGLTYTNHSGVSNGIHYNFKSGNEIPIGTTLTGAFVEYSEFDFKETIISETFHKIYNPIDIFDYGQTGDTVDFSGYQFSGATADNPFGLFYQPFYRLMIRQLSPYVETSTTNDVYNLPENCRYVESKGLWEWRDIYDQGYIDPDGYGTNFPFINGTHYVHSDINFYLRNEAAFKNKTNGVTSFNNISLNC